MFKIQRLFMFSLILSSFLWLSCQQVKPAQENAANESFIITGKVKNTLPKGMIVLQELMPELPGGIRNVDSVKVSADGSYTFKGKVKNPAFHRLSFFKKQYVLFVLGNNSVEINADGENKGSFEIKGGSTENAYLRQADALGGQMETQMRQLSDAFSEAVESNNAEKQVQVKNKFLLYQKESTQQLKKLMQDMGTSDAVFYALNMMDNEVQEAEFPFLDSLAHNFEKKSQLTPHAKYFVNMIAKKKAVSVGSLAPEIALQDTKGKKIALSSLRGKYVLIDFWASWCRPCREENPNVVKLYQKYKNKNFEIFGVSLDKDIESWTKAIEKDKLSWTHVSDLQWWESSVVPLYQIQGIPATVLLDPQGKIIAKNLRGELLAQRLQEILK
jgi:peroxiredoxin